MSISTLRKELTELSAEQLRSLVMDLYKTSKEAKEYLEFFVNPDLDKLYEKTIDNIAKEIKRSKYHRSKMRVSVVKQLISKFESYGAPAEKVNQLMLNALYFAGAISTSHYMTDSQYGYIKRLSHDIVCYSHRHELYYTAMATIVSIDDRLSKISEQCYARELIANGAEAAMKECGLPIPSGDE